MFYVAEALLEGEGLSFSKHSEVVGAFGLHFAKPGRVPQELHKYLQDAQEIRLEADYDYHDTVTAETASPQIDRARLFIQATGQQLGPAEPHSESH